MPTACPDVVFSVVETGFRSGRQPSVNGGYGERRHPYDETVSAGRRTDPVGSVREITAFPILVRPVFPRAQPPFGGCEESDFPARRRPTKKSFADRYGSWFSRASDVSARGATGACGHFHGTGADTRGDDDRPPGHAMHRQVRHPAQICPNSPDGPFRRTSRLATDSIPGKKILLRAVNPRPPWVVEYPDLLAEAREHSWLTTTPAAGRENGTSAVLPADRPGLCPRSGKGRVRPHRYGAATRGRTRNGGTPGPAQPAGRAPARRSGRPPHRSTSGTGCGDRCITDTSTVNNGPGLRHRVRLGDHDPQKALSGKG
jgi:hypothetical protein